MEVVAEVVRSGLVESRHRGVVVQVDAGGDPVWSFGDPDTVIFPRSTNKPLQAMGMLMAGLPLDGPQLALATASHSGEAFHLEAVRTMLAGAGLDESALQTPASYPMEGKAHADHLRAGGVRAPICMDCSGKHAAMLATCAERRWPTDTYLALDHPLQQQITATFTALTGARPEVVGTDGCGAPLLATSVTRLAAAFGRIAAARVETPDHARRLVAAMVAHPEFVSGSRRHERRLMETFPGAIAKSGAEAVLAFAVPDGSAWAVKIEDGSERALYAVLSRALEIAGLDHPILAERPVVLGGGEPVGQVRTAF